MASELDHGQQQLSRLSEFALTRAEAGNALILAGFDRPSSSLTQKPPSQGNMLGHEIAALRSQAWLSGPFSIMCHSLKNILWQVATCSNH